MAKNIQEFVVEKVLDYSYKKEREKEIHLYQLQKLNSQIDFLAKKLYNIVPLARCQYCEAYLHSYEFLEETRAHIPYLSCSSCDFVVCDDCLDEKGYDGISHDVCIEQDCNFIITCRDPNHEVDNYCEKCFSMVNAY